MAEETSTPVQTEPEQTAPEQTVPEQAAAPAAPGPAKKGGGLLLFLTALLIAVGVADVILWGVAGYYFLMGQA